MKALAQHGRGFFRGQVVVPEHLIDLLRLGGHVVVIDLRVQQIAEPPHTEDHVHGRGRGQPAVGIARHGIDPAVLHGAQLLPRGLGLNDLQSRGVGHENDIGIKVVELLHVDHVAAALVADILEHNGVEVDPHSIFDVQVKRLHEYKRQLLNILHVIYLYDQIKKHPEMDFYPRTFIFGAKASAGYARAKKIIKLINSVADVVNNDASIEGKLKVVFIENYRVSNAEMIFAAADVSEQISTASKEASGTGNMKFMLNGAPTLGTMDGANVEIVDEVGKENAFIFGLSADEVINYENNGGYDPRVIYNTDDEIRQVLTELVNGTFSSDTELFRDLYNSLLNQNGGERADQYFILADFRSYAAAQKKVEEAYKDEKGWARMAMLNTACAGKFTSDRTIQEYVDDIWHLDKVFVK